MSNTQYTPGPWHRDLGQIGKDWLKGRLQEAVFSADGTPVAICSDSAENADLIAAAPELLEALQSIVKSLADQDDEGMIEHAQQMIDARAAIAKATGAAA